MVERPEPGSAYGAQGGRPPILLSFDASAGAAVGVDFGHSHLRVAVSDLASTILAERTRPLDTDHDAQEGLEMAAELVVETLADAGVAREAVIGAGMGLPGPIDQGDGTVGSSAILPGWIGMTAAAELRRRLDVPVMVDNDANLGALAEAAFGAGRDAGDLIYLKISSGIGAGLILNGRLYRGSARPGGRARARARRTRTASSAAAATAAAWRRSPPPARSSTCCAARTATTSRCRRCSRPRAQGDAGCRRVIGDAGRALGQVVATLLNVLNPEMLIVGGDLAAAGDLLLDGVRESVARAALPETSRGAQLVAGVLGDRAQVLGALALVVSEADRALPTRLALAG